MKKIVAFILLTCMALTLVACTDNKSNSPETTTPQDTTSNDTAPEISMQAIYDADLTAAVLKNHQSIYIQAKMDGEVYNEKYLTRDYSYNLVPGVDEESDYAEFTTDDACFCYMGGDYLCYLSITPDGVSNFAKYRADRYASAVLSKDVLKDIIESVSQNDGRITVKSFMDGDALAELGVTSGKFEYVMDANTREIISYVGDLTLDAETSIHSVAEATYDAEVPEKVNAFLNYANQTDDLRNITVVSNPGTEKEESKCVQVPRGLIVGFRFDEESEYQFELYSDAACTEAYDPYANTDSDLTVYVKWNTKTA